MIPMASLYAALEVPESDRATPISRIEGEFVYRFVQKARPAQTLETGFAYGVSASYIMAATSCPHYAIDPAPHVYGHLGLSNIRRLGLQDRLRLEIDFAHAALPRLLAGGLAIDFAFIDGDHRFDGIFIDFYYVDLMLRAGGQVMFHDVWMPATQHVIAWIRCNKPNYQILSGSPVNITVVRKTGADERQWHDFTEFCQAKPWFGRARSVLAAGRSALRRPATGRRLRSAYRDARAKDPE